MNDFLLRLLTLVVLLLLLTLPMIFERKKPRSAASLKARAATIFGLGITGETEAALSPVARVLLSQNLT